MATFSFLCGNRYLGAKTRLFSRLSNLSSFQRFWLTKADYQENGPVIVHDNSKIFEDIKNSNSEVKAA